MVKKTALDNRCVTGCKGWGDGSILKDACAWGGDARYILCTFSGGVLHPLPPPQVWEVDLITHGGEAIFAGARLRSVVLHATAHERHSGM